MGCMKSNDREGRKVVAPGVTGPQSGILVLNVHEARLTRDTNTMTTMDPYMKIEMRQQ